MTGPSFRPTAPCPWCGNRTAATRGVCAGCIWLEGSLSRPVADSCALPPGDWVYDPRRGVQVYVEDPSKAVDTRPPCGTDSGYYAHRTRKEKTCTPCRYAHAEVARATAARRVAS